MDLSELQNTHVNRPRRKRVGRGIGSGRGKTCTKGTKGDKARSGYKRRLGNEGGQIPMFRKIPIRGFSRARFKKPVFAFNLADLETRYEEGETVSLSTLIAKKMLSTKARGQVKVLGEGEFTKKCHFEVHSISASAKEKVEAKGGTVKLSCSGP